jgi:hypothetical protein
MLKMLFIFDDGPETKQYGVFGSAAELGGVKGSLSATTIIIIITITIIWEILNDWFNNP